MNPLLRQLLRMLPEIIGLMICAGCLVLNAIAQMPPMPGVTVATPVKPLLSPRAKTTALTGQPMALTVTFYFNAVFAASTNGQTGLYWSPLGQQGNNYLGFSGAGVGHIAFTGPLPTNPVSLWATYADGTHTPMVMLDTNLILLSTNPAQPKIVNLRPHVFIAPPTNLTITIKPAYPCITIMGTTNLADWYKVGSTTNGLLTVICNQFSESYRGRVDAATVTLTWSPSTSPNVTGYTLIEYDLNTNVIATLTVSNVTSASMVVHRPDKCVMFACEAFDEPDMIISFPSAFTFYKPTWPILRISR